MFGAGPAQLFCEEFLDGSLDGPLTSELSCDILQGRSYDKANLILSVKEKNTTALLLMGGRAWMSLSSQPGCSDTTNSVTTHDTILSSSIFYKIFFCTYINLIKYLRGN